MSTNHLPLSTAMLLVLVRWMLPIVNKQKLDEKGPVNETKMTAALQRVIGKEPTFDDLQDIERGNVVTNFDRVGIEIPDNVAGLIVDFLASWTPELPHCNQPHCGLPSLVARGKRLDKSMKPGDVCPHCNAGTLTVTVRNDLILNWVVGSMVPKDQRFHNLTGMQVPIQEADLRGETAPGLLAMLDQKEVSIGKFLRYLLVDARHSVPNVRGEAVACLEAIGPTGVIVRRFAGFALGGLVDQAKAMVEGTVVKKVETGTGTGASADLSITIYERLSEAAESQMEAAFMYADIQTQYLPKDSPSSRALAAVRMCMANRTLDQLVTAMQRAGIPTHGLLQETGAGKPPLKDLYKILAKIWDDYRSWRRTLGDVGMQTSGVNFGNNAEDFWSEVVQKAQLTHGLVNALIDLAMEEAPAHRNKLLPYRQ